ncbi:MAG: efflux RND transporter periplasmic adaptor subunit, partial [Sphingomonas sp.]
MNYETRTIGNEEILGLPGDHGSRRPRWGIIAALVAAVLAIALIAFLVFGRSPAPSAKPVVQLPLVSVVVP